MQTQSSNWIRRAQATNALALAAMFNRPQEFRQQGELYLPEEFGEHEAVAADVDQDGKEDKTAIRLMPLTDAAGKAMAAGATAEIDFEPLRWVQILNFIVDPTMAADIVVTSFFIGQDNQFPAKGVVPANVFASNATNGLIDVPWCGPGVALTLSLKNVHASAARTFYGAARVRAVVG